jgi:beta-galactosidase
MRLGAAYYPERFKPEQWESDYKKMQDAGITTIRISEFAWSRLEPREGEFHWEWLDKSIALAEQSGIQVIMCTPTAAPPIWLVEKYKEVLPVNDKGERAVFGKRQHRCYSSEKYWEYSERIVEELAKRYGNHPNVITWQLDNEFGGERQRCYCENCEKAFQKYLEEKYRDIDELNDRWGNFFWSEDYQNFQQIRVPLEINAQLWTKYNPSLELDFWRFSSRNIVNYSNFQAALIRKHTSVPITTNTDPFYYGDTVNIFELFKNLDIAAVDVYSESLYEIGFYSDINRSMKESGKFLMTEFGVNNCNQYEVMDQLNNSGCELLSFFAMNAFPWGQEQGTHGLLTLTGEPTKNYRVTKKWHEDNKAKEQLFTSKYKVGIYYDFESSWTYSIASWGGETSKWIYPIYVLHTVYKSVFEKQGHVKFIYQPDDIKDVELLIVPKHIIYNKQLEGALARFVENGGKLVATDDIFKKNEDNVFLTYMPGIYNDIFGWEGKSFIDLKEESTKFVISEKTSGKGKAWIVRSDAGLEGWKELFEQII